MLESPEIEAMTVSYNLSAENGSYSADPRRRLQTSDMPILHKCYVPSCQVHVHSPYAQLVQLP